MQRMFLCARLPDVSSLFLNWIDENMLPKTLVWIPTAAYQEGDSSFVRARKSFFEIHGFSVEILELAEAEPAYAKNILKQARVLYISGGNTFFLLKEFQKCDLLDYIRQRVQQGMAYVGESAGAMLAAQDIGFAAFLDDPNAAPGLQSTEGLALVDFYPLPHWGDWAYQKGLEKIWEAYGESRCLVNITNCQTIIQKDGHRQCLEE